MGDSNQRKRAMAFATFCGLEVDPMYDREKRESWSVGDEDDASLRVTYVRNEMLETHIEV
jgi:hypothetical protein